MNEYFEEVLSKTEMWHGGNKNVWGGFAAQSSSLYLKLTCGSLWSEQSLCMSSRDWFTLFSSCRAHSRASTPLPHSSLSGFCNTKQVRQTVRHLWNERLGVNGLTLTPVCSLTFNSDVKGVVFVCQRMISTHLRPLISNAHKIAQNEKSHTQCINVLNGVLDSLGNCLNLILMPLYSLHIGKRNHQQEYSLFLLRYY